MTEEEIADFLFNRPKEFFELLEKKGVDLSGLKKIDLVRLMVKKRYGLTQEDIDAAEFVYWASYFEEREFKNIISEVEKASGATTPVVDTMLDRLHFGDKISIVAEHYATKPSDDNFIKMAWKVNNLRNDVAHGRFDKLTYDGFQLADVRGQLKLFIDLMNAALKK